MSVAKTNRSDTCFPNVHIDKKERKSFMTGRYKNIIPITLLMIFLLPSIVKLEHNHERVECKTDYEDQYSILHENCAICSLEFSTFLSHGADINFQKENPVEYYCNNYDSEYFSNHSVFSFLLRAPPLTNSI